MSSIVQNDTSPIDFFMADNTDSSGDTGKAGLLAAGITFMIAKGGGNFVAGTGTIAAKTGASVGWWQYTPVAADVGTLGDIAFEATASGCFKWKDIRRVVQAGAAASDWTTARAAKIDTIDTNATAIKAKTDNLPPDPADASDIAGSFGAVNTTLATIAGYVDTEVGAIKAKTDLLAIDGAGGVSIAAADKTALLNTILNAVIETNGATTISVKQALQLAAALPAGDIADILAGAGTQTIHVKSASGQPFLTITGDELGNRAVTRAALS